jgi:hypothetical protein
MKNYRSFICGLLVGAIATIGVGASAAAFVSAEKADNIYYAFNGRFTPLPDGYTTLMFENRVYVPARFIAENLGATVAWNAESRSVSVTAAPVPTPTPTPTPDPVPVPQPVSGITYQSLPVQKIYSDKEFFITAVRRRDSSYPVASIDLRVKNKGDAPLLIQQVATTAKGADGVTYKVPSSAFGYMDSRWFKDILKDEELEGYIVLSTLPDKLKEIQLEISVLHNDMNQKQETITFNIRID